jgi:uncharacterized protein (DUF58 family)
MLELGVFQPVKLLWRIWYRFYRIGSGLRYWVSRRFTGAGLTVLTGFLVAGLMGPDTENNVSYQAFTFLLCLLFAAMCLSVFYRGRFAVRRLAPRFGTMGSPLHYRVMVKNLSTRMESGITLLEDLEDPRPSFAEWHAAKIAEDRRVKSFRISGRRLGKPFRVATVTKPAVMPAGPQQEVEVPVELMPLRRGVLRLHGVTLARADALGLFRAFSRVKVAHRVMILPKRYPLPPIELPGTMRYQAGGVTLASNVGQSDEFVALRDYRNGDPIRHIHWRSWAKTGKPVVKEFEDEFFVRHALVLDTFTDHPNSEAFEEAVSVAASFACSIRTQESLLDLLFVGAESYCFTAGRGVGSSEQMLEILAAVQPCRDKLFSHLDHMVTEHVRSVSGCICVLIEWNEERRKFVQRLRNLGIPLLVVVVVPAGETLALDPGPMRDEPEKFHVIEAGHIEAGLAKMG